MSVQRGFSVIELTIALTISALVIGAVAAAVAPARAAFESTPAALDLQQRSRIGLELLASAIRSAGIQIPVFASDAGASDERASEIVIVSLVGTGASGMLASDQSSAGAALELASGAGCPLRPDVCGFVPGMSAAISDGYGRFDVFEASLTDVASRRVTPATALSSPYAAGARVFEIETSHYSLAPQPDGSSTLVRETQAGTEQPVLDAVVSLSFSLWGEASAPQIAWDGEHGHASYGPDPPPGTWLGTSGRWPVGESCVTARAEDGPRSRLAPLGDAGTLVLLTRALLNDGPWCEGGPLIGGFDADLFRIRRVDISLRLEVVTPTLRGPAGSLFRRAGTASAARWVPDRDVTMSIAVRNAK